MKMKTQVEIFKSINLLLIERQQHHAFLEEASSNSQQCLYIFSVLRIFFFFHLPLTPNTAKGILDIIWRRDLINIPEGKQHKECLGLIRTEVLD